MKPSKWDKVRPLPVDPTPVCEWWIPFSFGLVRIGGLAMGGKRGTCGDYRDPNPTDRQNFREAA